RNYLREYDFIIVGSGPAGCVLANRLTENPNWNVLLIEAGTLEGPIEEIPILAPYMFLTRYNWGYNAEPQPYACLGLKNGQCGFPRGRALGGTSVINGMLYTRGTKQDFERWVQLGNYGWDYEEFVLPAFKRSEKANLKYYYKPDYHNHSGLLAVEHNPHKTPIADIFINANKAMGLNEIDYNSDDTVGVAHLQANTLNGKRHSAYKSFIEPILRRKNLHIMLNTHATKVLINPKTRIAHGVEMIRRNRRILIWARKEVILSAGSFHSPQLLMLSGIGPKHDLDRIGVPLLHNSPVGKEMHDHISFPGLVFVTNLTNPTADFLGFQNVIPFMFQYLGGKGFMTIANGVEALGFIKTPTSNSPHSGLPDVELILLALTPQTDGGYAVKESERLQSSIYDAVYKPLENMGTYTFLIVLSLFHPKSVGYLELRNRNPLSSPKFFANFFKEPDDVETLLDAIKYTLRLIETEPFKKIGTRVHDIPIPSCAQHEFGSDDYWRCAIRTFCVSLHHQVGTCKMGPSSDPTAIVSPELKVYGVKRLRVVDTSIIPESTTSHTNAASFMIGERAADFIKDDWRS
ncbi:CLUMA_CG004124, isoform A, partial [Clunio marinus]